MDATQLDQELRSNKIRPCYLLVGPERHLVLTAEESLIKTVLKDSAEKGDRFQAGQGSFHKVLDALKTPAFLTPWRLVVVEEADVLKKEDWEALKKILSKPMEKTTLVLVALALKTSLLKSLPPTVAVVECKKLYPNQVVAWLNIQARNLGVPISQEAARYLADCVGADLGALSQALEKLFLFVGNKRLIQLEDVEKVAANTAQRNVFELTNAIGEKKPQTALQCLDKILEQGEEPLKTLSMISRHFRLLTRAQAFLAKSGGQAGPDFAKMLKVHPFFARDYAAQSSRFKPGGWKNCFAKLSTCDRALKSSRLPKHLILEKLVLELCRD